jgi:hypothetical protein
VVLESGLGVDPTTTWADVRRQLDGLTTVCWPARTRARRWCSSARRSAATSPSSTRALAQNSEGIGFGDLVRSAREVAAARDFPDVPLVVLKHGISFDPDGEPDPALERAWGRMQGELASRSPHGELVVAERSHHRIAEDQPDLVADAIRRVVEQARDQP